MASNRDDDGILEEAIRLCGPELGMQYFAVLSEWMWLWACWAEYVEMFGTTAERVQIINESGGAYFHMVQRTTWEAVLLGICRLTDKPKTGKYENLTVCALGPLCPTPSLQEAVRGLADHAAFVADFARDWRKKKIAHLDLSHAINKMVPPLPLVERQRIHEAINAIHAVLNCISVGVMNSQLDNSVILACRGSAVSLLRVLRDGLRTEAAREERLRTGEYTQDDLRFDPL
jgi:hypothetical protein